MKKQIRHIAFILIILLSSGVIAQTSVDSLVNKLEEIKNEKEKADLMLQIGDEYSETNRDLAKRYFKDAGKLSEKINYPRGVLKYIAKYTNILYDEAQPDSAINMNLQGLDLAREVNDTEYIGKFLLNTGNAYNNAGISVNAIEYYNQAKEYYVESDNPFNKGVLYNSLQILYTKIAEFEKGIENGEEAVKYLKESGNLHYLTNAYTNLGVNYQKANKTEKARTYYDKAIKLAKAHKTLSLENAALVNMLDLNLSLFELDSIPLLEERILLLNEKQDIPEYKAVAMRGLGTYYMYRGDFHTSELYLQEAVSLLEKNQPSEFLEPTYKSMANLNFSKKDFRKAEEYLKKAELLELDLIKENSKTLKLNYEFENEKKEAIIRLQEEKLKSKNLLIIILGLSFLSLLIIIWLLYRNYKQKRRFHMQELDELITRQKLGAAQAVLQGEQQERIRIARDLHDSLSGLLSGIKFSLNDIKGKLGLTPKAEEDFDRSIDMLDSAIKEIRWVAHNMMPEVLVRYGLNAALKDYIVEINKTGIININYHSMGLDDKKIEETTSIAIYRIIQELINNVIKHSGATDVFLQLLRENGRLVVNVEDNGHGFDLIDTKEKEGMGWKNIRSRVEFLDALIDVQSSEKQGTVINLEFNLA